MSLPGQVFLCFLLILSTATSLENTSKKFKLKLNKTKLKDALEELAVMKIAEMSLEDWWKVGRDFQNTIGFGFIRNLENRQGQFLNLKGPSFVVYLNIKDFASIAQRIKDLNLPEVATIAC